jgi:hypothetical protein
MLSSSSTTKKALKMRREISKDRRWADSKSPSNGLKKAITTIKLLQVPDLMQKSLVVMKNAIIAIEPDIMRESAAPGANLDRDPLVVVIETDRIPGTGGVETTTADRLPDIADVVMKEMIEEEMIHQDVTTIAITVHLLHAKDLPKEKLDVSLS